MAEYVIAGDGSPAKSYETVFEAAAATFESETATALCVAPRDCETLFMRNESIRPFIIKTLLYIGLLPINNTYGLIARIVETLSVHPDIEINRLISDIAQKACTPYDSIIRKIERSIDVYDYSFMERVCNITCTKPLTAKDVICDLAQYVRTKFYGGFFNE